MTHVKLCRELLYEVNVEPYVVEPSVTHGIVMYRPRIESCSVNTFTHTQVELDPYQSLRSEETYKIKPVPGS